MRVVIDTNVFVSGVFFTGPPHQILRAWADGLVELLVSPAILDEYQATGDELAAQFPRVDLSPWMALIASHALVVDAPDLPAQVCSDSDDDRFLACAIAGGVKVIVTGDKALLATSPYKGITVLTPRQFVDRHLA